ncbi:hypothetical protein ACLQ3C_21405, partial [Gordonia sp. DT30]|uniref:hypothetical protein n=1 Tax=unclassified Gordonia (in: high G+C Gram-positive bacteria) TaxID=2657482 RepID=UPI003CF38FEE
LILALAACTTPNTTPTPSASPSTYAPPWFLHITRYWVPTRALDLTSRDATFIRALTESDGIARLSSAHASVAYPGYVHARELHPLKLEPRRDPTSARPLARTSRFIGAFHSDGNTATATICVPGPGWSGEVLTYRRTGTPPPANQHGQHWYPIHNVFGDWQVLNDTEPATDQPPSLAVRQCASARIPEQSNPPNSPGWSWEPDPGA